MFSAVDASWPDAGRMLLCMPDVDFEQAASYCCTFAAASWLVGAAAAAACLPTLLKSHLLQAVINDSASSLCYFAKLQ
jgi:hypothetical protein